MKTIIALLATCFVLLSLGACGGEEPLPISPPSGSSARSVPTATRPMPEDKAWNFIDQRCTNCHSNTRIKKSRKRTEDEWIEQIDFCKGKGAIINPSDKASLALFLAGR
jgi:hypothetical protein